MSTSYASAMQVSLIFITLLLRENTGSINLDGTECSPDKSDMKM